MSSLTSYEDYVAFYNSLRAHANIDGYCVCNVPALASEELGKADSTGYSMTRAMVRMGCLIEFVSTQERRLKPTCLYKLGVRPSRRLYQRHVLQPALGR